MSMNSTDIQAVLFDFDGVLVDSEPIHFAAWQDALRPLGVEIRAEDFLQRFIGLEDKEAVRLVAEEQVPPRPLEELWPAFDAKQRIFADRSQQMPLVPQQTRDVIHDLKRAGYKVAVVTSSSRAEVLPLLKKAGIGGALDGAVFADDVTRKKPHPEPYLKAKHLLQAERALVMEDSDAGQTAARAAGCEVIRVTDVEQVASQIRERLNL
jgi:beta-phosphoglucomutase